MQLNIKKGASMKKLAALAFLFCLTSTIANAQVFESKKPITCGNVKFMVKTLVGEDINEHPIWVGTTDETKTRTVIFVNNTTQSWTIMQMDNKLACILGVGEGYSIKVIDEPAVELK
jgi:hypothetical protein